MFPVCEADTLVVGVVKEPDPSAASTVIDGEAAIAVGTPAAVELSWICHACTPGVAAEVAVPARAVHDHHGLAGGTVTPVTVIVCPDTDSTPTEEVVKPGPPRWRGAPAGRHGDGERADNIPPAAAVYVSVTVRPAWFAETTLIDDTAVPAPSAAYTVIEGEAARFASRPQLSTAGAPARPARRWWRSQSSRRRRRSCRRRRSSSFLRRRG